MAASTFYQKMIAAYRGSLGFNVEQVLVDILDKVQHSDYKDFLEIIVCSQPLADAIVRRLTMEDIQARVGDPRGEAEFPVIIDMRAIAYTASYLAQ